MKRAEIQIAYKEKMFLTIKAVEKVAQRSKETFRVELDRALSSLMYLQVFPSIAGQLEWTVFKGFLPVQMILRYHVCFLHLAVAVRLAIAWQIHCINLPHKKLSAFIIQTSEQHLLGNLHGTPCKNLSKYNLPQQNRRMVEGKKELKIVKILKTDGDGWIEMLLLKTMATEGKVGGKKRLQCLRSYKLDFFQKKQIHMQHNHPEN